MSRVKVHKVPTASDSSLPIFAELEAVTDRIRKRAFELFCEHGDGGRAVDDWLAAEREVCWPAAELEEEDDEFELKVALAGFEPDEVSVTASPDELIVKARHESKRKDDDGIRFTEFRREDVYRRVALPSEIDVDKVEASLKRGILKVEAPKSDIAENKARKVPVSTAA